MQAVPDDNGDIHAPNPIVIRTDPETKPFYDYSCGRYRLVFCTILKFIKGTSGGCQNQRGPRF